MTPRAEPSDAGSRLSAQPQVIAQGIVMLKLKLSLNVFSCMADALLPSSSKWRVALLSALVVSGLAWGTGVLRHVVMPVTAQQGVLNINTVVGSGGSGTGLFAQFNNARGIAAASSTVFYVADTANHVVRKIDTTAGTSTIFAGLLGQAGVSGDGALATAARLSSPSDVALDAAGNVYISDSGNHKIRKVDAANLITTFAGSGTAGTGLTVTGSSFNIPLGLAFSTANSDSLLIADSGNHRIVSLNNLALTPTLTLIAGSSSGQSGSSEDGDPASNSLLNRPTDVAVATNNRIVIADTDNHRVRVIASEDVPRVRNIVGTGISGFNAELGTGASIQLHTPSGVSADATGLIYISDTLNHRIRTVDTNGSVNTIAGRSVQGYNGDGSPATNYSLNSPMGLQTITVSSAVQLLLMDAGNNRLRKVAAGALSTVISDGSGGFAGDDGPAASAKLDGPGGFAADAQGNWYIADTNNQVVRRVNVSDGKIITYAGSAGMASASPTGVNGDGAAANLATLNAPSAVAVDAQGNLFIADTGNRRIRRVDATSKNISTVMGMVTTLQGASELNQPTGVAVDALGNLYVADAGNHVVIAQNSSGGFIFRAGQTGLAGSGGDGSLLLPPPPASPPRLKRPTSVAVSGTTIYVSDSDNHRIRRIRPSTSGIQTAYTIDSYAPYNLGPTQVTVRDGFDGDGLATSSSTRLRSPAGIATDAAGNLYISDRGNGRIRRIDAGTRIIETVIGNGTIGFGGDGGPALSAALSAPLGVFATATNVFVADTGNNRIRRTSTQPNAAPVLTSPGNKTIAEGAALTFALSATDQVGQTLTYSMTSTPALPTTAPNNATLDAATGAFSWTPSFDVVPNTTPVNFQVTFTATDNVIPPLSNMQIITITVNPANRPPVVDSGAIPAAVEATSAAGAPVQLVGSASDPDGDAITTVTWTDTRPSQAAVTIGSTLSINPTLALGAHSIVLTASAGVSGAGGTASTTARALVVQDTTAPTFSGTQADITEVITTGNSKVVTFTLPTATDLVSGARTVTAVPVSGTAFPLGSTTVTLTASDVAGNVRTATFRVIVSCQGTGCAVTNSSNYNIAAYAGSGSYGNGGDGGQGTAASFRRPRGIAAHTNGTIYVADEQSHQIRAIAANGVVSLLAGVSKGFVGDGAAAASARLNSPTGLALDSARNLLYVADTNNQRIRRIDLVTNVITTFAGNGAAGMGTDGTATTTPLNFPQGLAVDSAGNVYVADTGNSRVVRIAGTALTTLAGNGSVGFAGDGAAASTGRFNHPTGIAVTGDGLTVYVADRGNQRIRRINSNTISTFAGTGANATTGDGAVATAAGLNNPLDVLVDAANNVFITETDGERIRRVDAADNKISTIAGNGNTGFSGDDGPGFSATMNTPTGITRNVGGELYFCDTGNLRVRRLIPTGPTNRPPVPDNVPNQSLTKSQSLTVALSATDADSDPVTFTLVPALSFVTITNANPTARTASLFINPNGANVGVYNVQVQAADNKAATGLSSQFTITVTDPNAPPNQPPTARMNTLQSTIFAPSGATAATVNLDGSTSTDPENGPLTYEWYDNNVKVAMGVTAAVQLTIGQHAVRLEVIDNGGARGFSATQNITVQGVTQGNRNPVAVASRTPADPIVLATNGVDIDISFNGSLSTDPDGDPITYQWFNGTNTTPFATTVSPVVRLPVGSHSVRLRVSDNRGGVGESAELAFTIEGPAPDVVITGITPNSGRRGATVNVVIVGTGFTADSRVSVNGGGINATTLSVTATRITARFVIASNAQIGYLGKRAITVTDITNGRTGSSTPIFTVLPVE